MRKADLINNHKIFDDAMARYYNLIKKILDAERVIKTKEEKRDLAESVMLRICAYWEYFVDEQLIDCINVNHSKLSDYFGVPIPANPSKMLCHALIIGDGYTDFKGFGDLLGYSKKLLPPESNPFLKIGRASASKIDEVYIFRNYLAHYSFKAKNTLFKLYKASYGMTRFIEPGMFLLGYHGYRLFEYIDSFKNASAEMKRHYTGT